MAVIDQAGSKVVDAVAAPFAATAPGGKDTYDAVVQQRFSNDPDLLKKLNDPIVKKILMAAVGDAIIKGNEKFLQEILPSLVDKVNTAQIDLNKADSTARIESEADRARQFYAGWLAQQNAQADIDKQRAAASLEANKTGYVRYEAGAAGFASFMRVFTAIADAFSQGSLQPIRDFIAEFSAPKNVRIASADASTVRAEPENGYTVQHQKLEGAATPGQLSSSMDSPAPLMTVTGATPPTPVAANPSAAVTTSDIKTNAGTMTTPKTPVRAPAVPMIKFGGAAPSLELK